MTHSDIDSKASSSFYTHLSRQWLPSPIQKHFTASKTFHIWCLLYTSQDCHKIRRSRHESESHPVMSDSVQPHGLYSPWNSPGQNTGVGSLSLLQAIFPTQALNPGLLLCRQILYQLSHKVLKNATIRSHPLSRESHVHIICFSSAADPHFCYFTIHMNHSTSLSNNICLHKI